MDKELGREYDLNFIARDCIAKYRKEILGKAKEDISSPTSTQKAVDLVNSYCDAVEKVIDLLIPLYDSPYGGPVILALASLTSGCGHIKALESKVSRLLIEITSTEYDKRSENEIILELLNTLKKIMPNSKSEGKEEVKVANGKGKQIVEEVEQAEQAPA